MSRWSPAVLVALTLSLIAPAAFGDEAAYDAAVEKAEQTLDAFGEDALREEFEQMPDDVEPVEKGIVDGILPADSDVISVILLVEKSKQTMKIKINGNIVDSWKVSTGKIGHRTPNYTNRPVLKMVPDYWSRKYNSPMPYSIFITPAIAIHATTQDQYPLLGSIASHGCVRQRLDQAKALYAFVKKHRAKTRIWVVQ